MNSLSEVTQSFKYTLHIHPTLQWRECSKHTGNTMMFNIKIRKLLHSYPENQLCKKQMLDVFSPPHTHTRAHIKLIRGGKKSYLQNKMANVQQKNIK